MLSDYGNGKSCGMDTTVFSKVITGLKYEDVKVEDRERTILKELAACVGSLARSKVMEDKRDLWRKNNGLKHGEKIGKKCIDQSFGCRCG